MYVCVLFWTIVLCTRYEWQNRDWLEHLTSLKEIKARRNFDMGWLRLVGSL